jgi:TP901 family phage tail tape measure protein
MTDIASLAIEVDSRQARTAKRDLDEFAKTGKRAGDELGRFSKSGKTAAASAGKVAAAVGALVAASAGLRGIAITIADFDRAMSKVAAITRATNKEIADLSAVAKQLGSSTEFSAQQAAQGLEFLGRAGFSAAEAVKSIPAVLDLATSAAMDLGRAADISSNIMSAFSIEAENAADVADVLAAASSRANTDVEQLGAAMSFVGPVASALGIGMSDAAAAVGVLSDAGIQGSAAGTGLRRVLSSLSNPTRDAERTLSALGVTMEQVNPQTNDIADVIQRLSDVGLSAADALTIFGDRGGPAVLALTSQTGRLRDLTEALSDVDGEASRMADTMRDNLGGDLDSLKSAAQGLILALGEAGLTAVIRGVIQVATGLVRTVSQMVDAVGFVLGRIGEFKNSVLGLGTSQRQLSEAIETANRGFSGQLSMYNDLAIPLQNGATLTRDVALAQLELAENTKAAIDAAQAQIRQQIEASSEWQELERGIQRIVNQISILDAGPDLDGAIAPSALLPALQKANEQIGDLRDRQMALLDASGALPEEYEALESRIHALREALESATGETVVLGKSSQEVATNISEAERVARALAAINMANGITPAVNAARDLSKELGVSLQRALAISGALDRSVTADVFDPRDQRFESEEFRLERIRRGMEDIEYSTQLASKSVTEFGRAGGGAGRAVADSLSEAEEEADRLQKQLDAPMVSAIDSVAGAWGDFIAGGLQDFKGFVDQVLASFQRMIADMIATAARSRLMQAFGMGGGGGAPAGGFFGSIGSGFGSVVQGLTGGGIGGAFGAVKTALGSVAGGGLAGLGTAIGAIAGPATLAITAIRGLVGSTKTLDKGIQVTVSETDILAERFKKIQRTRFFGLSRSTSTRTSDLDANTAAQVEAAAGLVRDSVFDAAAALGIGADAFEGFTAKIRISTRGLSEGEIATAIAEQIGGVADAMAETIPELAEFARQGETAGDTLLRLANDLDVVNTRFQALGFALNDASLAGAAAASSFVELFGSLEAFEQSTSFFFTEFYSAAEQLDAGATDLVRTLTELGVSAIPATRAEFRGLVSDLLAAGDQAAAASVIQLAPAFVELERLADQVASDAQARADALARQAQQRQSAARSAYDDAVNSFKQAVQRERSQIEDAARDLAGALEDQLQAAEQRLRGSTDIYEALLEASTGRRFNAPGASAASLAQGQATLEGFLARGGVDDPDALDRALQAVSEPSEALYSDFLTYAREFGKTSDTIEKLLAQAEDTMTADEAAVDALERQLARNDVWRGQQLERLDNQLARSTDVFNEVGTVRVATDNVQAAVVTMRGTVVNAIDDQISATNIMKNALLSALNQGFSTSVSGGSDPSTSDSGGGATTTGGTTPTTPTPTTYTASDFSSLTQGGTPGVAGPLGGWRSRQDLFNAGAIPSASRLTSLDLARLADAVNSGQYPAFAAGGLHMGGIRLVGEQGPEIEATGPARYYSARQTQDMMGGAASEEIKALRRDVNRLLTAVERNTRRTAAPLRRWDQQGGVPVINAPDTTLETTP